MRGEPPVDVGFTGGNMKEALFLEPLTSLSEGRAMPETNNNQPQESVSVDSSQGKNYPSVQSKPKTIKEWLSANEFKNAIASALPSHMTPERFVRIALTATMRIPKLAQCTQSSIFKCLLDLSSLGLEPDGRLAHLIPYENKKTGVITCQLIIDYKGLIDLAKRSGEVKNWRSELVCENDKFSWDNGIITHKVDWFTPRGKTKAVYSHVKNKNDVDDYEIMTLDEVELIRKRSKTGQSGPWVTDFNEMAKKTVMRRHSKRLTLSPEFADALEKDDDRLEDIIPTYSLDELMPKEKMDSQTIPENAELKFSQHTEIGTGPKIVPDGKIGFANDDLPEKRLELMPAPDSPITLGSIEKISIALRDKKMSKDILMVHVLEKYGKKTLSDLNQSSLGPILKWINDQTV